MHRDNAAEIGPANSLSLCFDGEIEMIFWSRKTGQDDKFWQKKKEKTKNENRANIKWNILFTKRFDLNLTNKIENDVPTFNWNT